MALLDASSNWLMSSGRSSISQCDHPDSFVAARGYFGCGRNLWAGLCRDRPVSAEGSRQPRCCPESNPAGLRTQLSWMVGASLIQVGLEFYQPGFTCPSRLAKDY